MTLELTREVLGWCAIINVGLLIWWSCFIMFAGDFCFRMHSKLFPMTRERFFEIHYAGIMAFKVFVFAVNVVPYVALKIVG